MINSMMNCVRWGSVFLSSSPRCFMVVTRPREVKGLCTISGHCWAGKQTKLLHEACRMGGLRSDDL